MSNIQTNASEYSEIKEVKCSDHRKFSIMIPGLDLKASLLNTAQFGVVKVFPGNEDGTLTFSAVYRDPKYLSILHHKKADIHESVVRPLFAVAKDHSYDSMPKRNEQMEKVSRGLIPLLQELGLPVTEIKMGPLAAFNPGVESKDLWANPENYIAGPSFWYENDTTHRERIKSCYNILFEGMPAVALAQEVQFGKSFDIDFTDLHQTIMEQYPNYHYTNPVIDLKKQSYTTCSVTYYDKTVLEDVSEEFATELDSFKGDFKNKLGTNDDRLVVSALKHLATGTVYKVVNLHAIYAKANQEAVYPWLNGLFKENQHLIVGGVFNLQAKNVAFTNQIQTGDDIRAVWGLTPEPADVGNPTFDGIIVRS